MEKAEFEKILKTINHYYPIENSQSNSILEILNQKHLKKLEISTYWEGFNLKLKDIINFEIDNIDYSQFPSLVVKINDIKQIDDIKIYRQFTLSISLLGNYYTYFYDYFHSKKLEKGSIFLAGVSFLNDKKFEILKLDIDLNIIISLIKEYFAGYIYINHFDLMINNVQKIVPYGFDNFDSEEKSFNIYQILFEHQNGNQKITY